MECSEEVSPSGYTTFTTRDWMDVLQTQVDRDFERRQRRLDRQVGAAFSYPPSSYTYATDSHTTTTELNQMYNGMTVQSNTILPGETTVYFANSNDYIPTFTDAATTINVTNTSAVIPTATLMGNWQIHEEPVAERVRSVGHISELMMRENRQMAIEHMFERLSQMAIKEWTERNGELPTKHPIWVTWIKSAEDSPHRTYEVGLELFNDDPRSKRWAESVWRRWAEEGVQTTVAGGRPRVPTPEEARAAEERRLEREAERERLRLEQEERKRQEAEEKKRAEELLLSNLTPKQRKDWEEQKGFEVCVGEGRKRRYWIARGRAGNVYGLTRYGSRYRRFCIHPTDRCPDEDTVLAQKLWLEGDEKSFLATANASPYR